MSCVTDTLTCILARPMFKILSRLLPRTGKEEAISQPFTTTEDKRRLGDVLVLATAGGMHLRL